MRVAQTTWSRARGWHPTAPAETGGSASLVLAFGSREALKDQDTLRTIQAAYPNALVSGCSTAGEICDGRVSDDSVVVTAVELERSRVAGTCVHVAQRGDSFAAARQLVAGLSSEGLRHVLVLSDGLQVNGSQLAAGLGAALPAGVGVSGGLSADGGEFRETVVVWNGKAASSAVAAIGFYGEHLRAACGSLGGWKPFGPWRLITRSKGSVLYELDGQSALELYKRYLGEHASGLPSTGLLFPLSLSRGTDGEGVVRSVLNVDEGEDSMIFAGDLPEGNFARLMMASAERLVDGAIGAARQCSGPGRESAELAILISCVGRKMVLKQRTEEELEGVRSVLGEKVPVCGFYSYGEISPFDSEARCELRNQTMTVTTLSEEKKAA